MHQTHRCTLTLNYDHQSWNENWARIFSHLPARALCRWLANLMNDSLTMKNFVNPSNALKVVCIIVD